MCRSRQKWWLQWNSCTTGPKQTRLQKKTEAPQKTAEQLCPETGLQMQGFREENATMSGEERRWYRSTPSSASFSAPGTGLLQVEVPTLSS